MVLKQFAKKAGLTLQILNMPPGSVTYTNDEKWYTPTEALDILHGYLLQKGFVMIKRDRFLVVLNIDIQPIPPNLIPNITIADLEDGDFGKHELLSVVLPLEEADANDAAREVEALLGPQGKVAPLSVSNSVVVTDTYSNLQRIHGLLKGVTAKVDPETLLPKAFPLKYVAAGEAEIIVRDQLGLGSGVTNVSAGSNGFGFSFGRGSSSSRGSSSRSNNSSNSAPEPKVTADPRTNTLFVTGTKNQLAIAEQVLLTLDVSDENIANPGMRNAGVPYLKVYHLQRADAREVTKTLDAIIPGVVVNEDGRERTIHIKATDAQHEKVAKLIAELDGTGSNAVAIIPLSKSDPMAMASMLSTMFVKDGEDAPTIHPDAYNRQLMVRGSNDQIAQIKLMLNGMGEDGSGKPNKSEDGSPFRLRNLEGRDAEEFARTLERIWSMSSSTPVRVVIPSNNPIRERVIPSLMDEPRNLGPARPTTERRSPLEELDSQSTYNDRRQIDADFARPLSGVKPLFPVSMEISSTDPAAAQTKAGQKQTADQEPAQAERVPEKPAEQAAPIEAAPIEAAPKTDPAPKETAAPEEQPPAFPKTATLRLNKVGQMTFNGQPIDDPSQLSIRSAKWLAATPADREFIISSHPQTPAVVLTPVLGVLNKVGVRPSLKISAEEISTPAEKPQTPSADPKNVDPPNQNSQSAAPGSPAKSGEAPIFVTVRGNDLMLSGNSESLDEMEAMIEQLARAIPPRTTWTVYYLRSADAYETSLMLEQLFPTSSVGTSLSSSDDSIFGGLSNSLASLGNGLVDVAGMSSLTQNPSVLKIIPELRSNSLFVTGPADQVRAVEHMLQVLDADDLPETLKDRVPRMIPVEYANVSEVATIVKDVYKDYLEDNSRQQQGRARIPSPRYSEAATEAAAAAVTAAVAGRVRRCG